MAAWWRERRYVALLDLIEDLYKKPTSRMSAALVNDPEAAAELAAQPEPSRTWTPPVTDWDLHATLQAEMLDRLGELIGAVLATIPVEKGKSRPKFKAKPFPRPRTAVDRARELATREVQLDIIRRFAPHALN